MESNKLPETQNTTSRKLPEKSRVLILVGAPGSGKSTFAKSLCSYDKSWRRVNQDDMGDRSTCERYTRRWLKEGRNAVIDRCNFDEKQRKTWIRIAFEFDLLPEVIFFTTPFQECENRVQAREEHPTGVVGEEGLEVLRRFQRMLTRPTLEEGFYKALEIDTRQAIFVDGYYTNEYILQQLNALSHSPVNPNIYSIRKQLSLEENQGKPAHAKYQNNYHNSSHHRGYSHSSHHRGYSHPNHQPRHPSYGRGGYSQGNTQYRAGYHDHHASQNWRHQTYIASPRPEHSRSIPNQPWRDSRGAQQHYRPRGDHHQVNHAPSSDEPLKESSQNDQ